MLPISRMGAICRAPQPLLSLAAGDVCCHIINVINVLAAAHERCQMIDTSIVRVHQNGACVARGSELVVGEGFEMSLGRIGHKPMIIVAIQKPYRSQIVQSLWRKIRSPGLKSSFLQLSGFSARQKVWQMAGFSTVFSVLWNECRNKLAEREGFELLIEVSHVRR
jgi:hypothetical protein